MITVEQLADRLGLTVEFAEHIVGCAECWADEDGGWLTCLRWRVNQGEIMHGPMTRKQHDWYEERKGWSMSRLMAEVLADAMDRPPIEFDGPPVKATLYSAIIPVSREVVDDG